MTTHTYTISDASGKVLYRVREDPPAPPPAPPPPPPPPPAPATTQLLVPWASQLGPSADYAPGDCGPACTTMWLHHLGHTDLTVNDCSQETGLAPGYNYTMPAHLMNIMRHWGYETFWRDGLVLDDIVAEIDRGNPLILLVEYDQLPRTLRYDLSYQYGHWILVVGYTRTHTIYHDPYFPSTALGAFKHIQDTSLMYAWGHNSDSGNRNYQAIRLT